MLLNRDIFSVEDLRLDVGDFSRNDSTLEAYEIEDFVLVPTWVNSTLTDMEYISAAGHFTFVQAPTLAVKYFHVVCTPRAMFLTW